MTGLAPTETLSYKIGAAHDLMQHILHDPANELDGILWGALSGLEIILREAREQVNESKPDAPVMMDGEPIRNLEKELIAVLREVVEKIGLAESRGSYLLDHIDESRPNHDKAAVSSDACGKTTTH